MNTSSMSYLGEGVYGTVYRVSRYGKDYAQKCESINKHVFNSTVLSELDTLSRLKGFPYFVRLDDFQINETQMCLYLEYMNVSMEKYIQQTTPSQRLINFSHIFRNLLQGLYIMQEMNIHHYDIKPANILFNISGDRITNVVYADFGLSRTYVPHCEKINVVTLWYRSPELLLDCRKPNIDNIDIWSLGMTLLEYLVGRPAYYGEQKAATNMLFDYVPLKLSTIRQNLYITNIHFPVDSYLTLRNIKITHLETQILNQILSFNPHLRPRAKQLLIQLGEPIVSPVFIISGQRKVLPGLWNLILQVWSKYKQIYILPIIVMDNLCRLYVNETPKNTDIIAMYELVSTYLEINQPVDSILQQYGVDIQETKKQIFEQQIHILQQLSCIIYDSRLTTFMSSLINRPEKVYQIPESAFRSLWTYNI